MNAFDPQPHLSVVKADSIHFDCPCEDCEAERNGEEPGNAMRPIIFCLPISIMGWIGIAMVLHFCHFV